MSMLPGIKNYIYFIYFILFIGNHRFSFIYGTENTVARKFKATLVKNYRIGTSLEETRYNGKGRKVVIIIILVVRSTKPNEKNNLE